ncbi:ABC-type polar amino acid transport system ATPase component [Methanonatronarchaeum thermophilum]|uniref:ABC-type polar amino acid transport system ATPase component n=1 Tax=Methanonatronarchaeum thermophilum TaxID=1927129 RepID=A0A1Y3G9W4_9EURY|nr:phosphate ABC transporter ATP-binding protein [Methanonatronarchaeum thermophilum]OUJ18199.1 ABC-type polar amino acid transport system ATPase component [Methanonatronarchaeum thermophilum]
MSMLKTKNKDKFDDKGVMDRISLTDVSFGFDSPILENVNLELESSEVLAVIGPSGTGKTTLLRLLSLFYKPDEGNVFFDNKDVWSVSKKQRLSLRRKIGMVFQRPNLFNSSVHNNVKYGLKVRQTWRDRLNRYFTGVLNKNTDPRVVEKLRIVGLEDYIQKDASSLSGGEAQRVAFARALAYEPEYLLLDEPTSDLDPRNTAIIEEAIHKAREKGIGIAVATHDMNQAERIADRVAVIINGQILEVGDAETIFNNPKNQKTKRFIEGKLVY